MKAVFWLSLGVVLYTYAGYPLLMGGLARWRSRPWVRAAWPAGEPPVSIVMAVHNGGTRIAAQVEHLLGLDRALVKEVIVVSDGSHDETAAVLESAHHERLRVLLIEHQGGKAAAVNRGVTLARGEIVLFVDLRPRVEEGALALLLTSFADPTVGCVAGELCLTTDGHDGTAAAVSGLYWKYEQWIRNCEAAFDSPVGVYGGFYAVRRALVAEVPAGLILDDMFQPLAIIRQGYRSVVDQRARVVDRWPARASGEFSRKVRTLAGNFQLIAEAPWVVSLENRVWAQLISHKLLRLVVPYCLLALLLSSAWLGGSFAVFAALQDLFWAMAALALWGKIPAWVPIAGRVAAPAGALLVLNAAAVAGLWRFLFTPGPLWKIWLATPESTAD